MISNKTIQELLEVLKRIQYDKEYFEFPEKGEHKMLEAYSLDGKIKFLIDIVPSGNKRRKNKIKYQERFNKDVILVRLDLNGPPHTNPDGTIVSGNHLHIVQDEYDDRFAIEIPEGLIDETDRIQTLINFLKYCNVENPVFANFERRLLYE